MIPLYVASMTKQADCKFKNRVEYWVLSWSSSLKKLVAAERTWVSGLVQYDIFWEYLIWVNIQEIQVVGW